MAISIGDIIRVTAKMQWNEEDIQNVYHLEAQSATSDSDLTVLGEIADTLDSAYDYLDTAIPNDVTFDSIVGYNLTQERYMGEVSWPTLTAGSNVGDPLPPQTAPLVRFGTDTLGSQGRKFFPPMTDADLDSDGTISSAVATALGNVATILLAGVDSGTWTMKFGNWNVDLARFATWVSAFVNAYYATQRRRRPGVGS